jgi:hypothetical protein
MDAECRTGGKDDEYIYSGRKIRKDEVLREAKMDNIGVDLDELGYEDVDWIELARNLDF